MSALSYLGVSVAPMVKVRDVPSPKGTFLVSPASPASLPLWGAGPTPAHTMAIGSGEHHFLAMLEPGPASSGIASPRLWVLLLLPPCPFPQCRRPHP
jgi:hypothetical protein